MLGGATTAVMPISSVITPALANNHFVAASKGSAEDSAGCSIRELRDVRNFRKRNSPTQIASQDIATAARVRCCPALKVSVITAMQVPQNTAAPKIALRQSTLSLRRMR